MDGMQRSVSFELNGKAPFGLFNAVVGCKGEQLHDLQPSSATDDSSCGAKGQ